MYVYVQSIHSLLAMGYLYLLITLSLVYVPIFCTPILKKHTHRSLTDYYDHFEGLSRLENEGIVEALMEKDLRKV